MALRPQGFIIPQKPSKPCRRARLHFDATRDPHKLVLPHSAGKVVVGKAYPQDGLPHEPLRPMAVFLSYKAQFTDRGARGSPKLVRDPIEGEDEYMCRAIAAKLLTKHPEVRVRDRDDLFDPAAVAWARFLKVRFHDGFPEELQFMQRTPAEDWGRAEWEALCRYFQVPLPPVVEPYAPSGAFNVRAFTFFNQPTIPLIDGCEYDCRLPRIRGELHRAAFEGSVCVTGFDQQTGMPCDLTEAQYKMLEEWMAEADDGAGDRDGGAADDDDEADA